MKQTEKYGLNLLEMKDAISPAPLNENAQVIETLLHNLSVAAEGQLKIASGSYTGTGTMSVSIETPGVKPRAMLVRRQPLIGCGGHHTYQDPAWVVPIYTDKLEMEGGWLLWLGWDIPVTYSYVTKYNEDGEPTDGENVDTTVRFDATLGGLQWSVTEDTAVGLPALVNNVMAKKYDWIVIGTAGE